MKRITIDSIRVDLRNLGQSKRSQKKRKRTMRPDEKVRPLFRSGHPAEKSREPAVVRPAKGAKPGDKVVRLIRRTGSKTKKRL